MLAEPAGGWSASVNGHALAADPSPAGSWAQAFRLPAGGGKLTVANAGLTRDLLLLLELLAFLIIAALALPGIHVAEPDGVVAATGDRPAGRAASRAAGRGSSGAAGRRAAAGTGAAGTGAPAQPGAGRAGAGADLASAQTAVMDRVGRADDLAGAGLAGAGLGEAGLAGAGLGGAGLAGPGLGGAGLAGAELGAGAGLAAGVAGAAAARGAGDDAGDGDDADAIPGDVATGRRGLVKGGRGRSKGGRGTRGRGARGRDAARQRTGLTKGSRAALAATGAAPPDGGPEDVAETTLLATGDRGTRAAVAGVRPASPAQATGGSRTLGHTNRAATGTTPGSPTPGPITAAATASKTRAAAGARGSSGPPGSIPIARPARRRMTSARRGGPASTSSPADPVRSADRVPAGTATGPTTTWPATRCAGTGRPGRPHGPGRTPMMPPMSSPALAAGRPDRAGGDKTATWTTDRTGRRRAGARHPAALRPGARPAATGRIPSWTRPAAVTARRAAARLLAVRRATPGPAGTAGTPLRPGGPRRTPAPAPTG